MANIQDTMEKALEATSEFKGTSVSEAFFNVSNASTKSAGYCRTPDVHLAAVTLACNLQVTLP